MAGERNWVCVDCGWEEGEFPKTYKGERGVIWLTFPLVKRDRNLLKPTQQSHLLSEDGLVADWVAWNNRNVLSHSLEVGSLSSRCQQGWFLLEALRECLSPSGDCQQPLAYRGSTPVSASVFTRPSTLSPLQSEISLSVSLIRTLVVGFGAPLDNLGLFHLKIPNWIASTGTFFSFNKQVFILRLGNKIHMLISLSWMHRWGLYTNEEKWRDPHPVCAPHLSFGSQMYLYK